MEKNEIGLNYVHKLDFKYSEQYITPKKMFILNHK